MDPVADLHCARTDAAVQSERADHRTLVILSKRVDVIRAVCPQIFGLATANALSLHLSGGLSGPRHPRSQVVEASADGERDLIAVGLADAGQHAIRHLDGFWRRRRHLASRGRQSPLMQVSCGSDRAVSLATDAGARWLIDVGWSAQTVSRRAQPEDRPEGPRWGRRTMNPSPRWRSRESGRSCRRVPR
jgi:hypothetical protein